MKNIYLCDYIGTCDEDNKPTGHQIKVLNEYYNILQGEYSIRFAIPKFYIDFINNKDNEDILTLESYIKTGIVDLKTKLNNLYYKISSIRKILLKTGSDTIWFVNFDYFLGLVLLFTRIPKNKNVILTTFMDEYNNNSSLSDKIKSKLFKFALSKSNLIITSNKIVSKKYCNSIFVPDYYYHDEYNKYKNIEKKNKVINVGTMGQVKDLEGLIDKWNIDTYTLEINGRFEDEKRYNKLKIKCDGNIIIKNNNLSYIDYLSKIAESKFVILPYKESSYSNRSSGVLLETIFLGSIPIAPKFLLNFNNIKGVDYEKFISGEIDLNNQCKLESILNHNNHLITSIYNQDKIKQTILDAIKERE